MTLRLIFMGSPDFAVPALKALHSAGHDIVAVYAQPPKPAGRGQHLQKTPVHLAAENLGLTVHTPRTLRDEQAQQIFASHKADIAVVAAYGLILPQIVLDMPRLGCINIHGSLLPRWRGAAPIQRAILAGDKETGITIMQMAAGLDTGDMLMKGAVPITNATTASSLHDELSLLGAQMIVPSVEKLARGELPATPQPEEGVTYAAKLTRAESQIDWRKPAIEIERQVHALTPWPGTVFTFGDEVIKLVRAELVSGASGPPGALLDSDFTVACGDGALRLLTVQRAGKAATDGPALLRGMRLEPGFVFP